MKADELIGQEVRVTTLSGDTFNFAVDGVIYEDYQEILLSPLGDRHVVGGMKYIVTRDKAFKGPSRTFEDMAVLDQTEMQLLLSDLLLRGPLLPQQYLDSLIEPYSKVADEEVKKRQARIDELEKEVETLKEKVSETPKKSQTKTKKTDEVEDNEGVPSATKEA